jgi:Mitochondrial ATPase expression
MSFSICPRCALRTVRAQRRPPRPSLSTVWIWRRSFNSMERRFGETAPDIASIKPPNRIQQILHTFDPLIEPTYTTLNLSPAFTKSADPEITALLQAVAAKDDVKWWELYTQLSLTGGLKRLKRMQFSQILLALHPVNFHRNTGTNYSNQFIHRVAQVKADMESFGYYLGHTEWNHLLDVARASYRPDQTQKWWDDMNRNGIPADTFAYNNYLNSLCGKAPHLQHERPLKYKIDENGKLVSLGKSPSKSLHTYQRFPSSGKSLLATNIVQQMVSQNVPPNAATYEALIVAFARDNDLDTVNDIIRRIWGFNPDGTPTKDPPVTARTSKSPLWPTEHTLNAIANAYGYNGSLAAAIALVEALSSRYKIRITVAVWLSLLLWTSRRSTLYRRPRLGFISPLAAPRLFKVMTSPPYEISPGVEAYWHMINHERKRRARGSTERLLVDVIKRYGPNGTDLTPENAHLAWRVLAGVKNWVPVLCDALSRNGERDRAVSLFRRWQHRFHALETTGLLRIWDEVEPEQQSNIPGVILPSTNNTQTSYSIRKKLAKASAKERLKRYRFIRLRRKEHYPARWKGPGRPLFLPFGINVQHGLGSPARQYRKSHALWQKHVQGSFKNSSIRNKELDKQKKQWKIRSREPWNKDREERKRILGMKSGYLAMKKEFEYLKRKGYYFGQKQETRPRWKTSGLSKSAPRGGQGRYVGRFHLRNELLERLKQTEVVPEVQTQMRDEKYLHETLEEVKDLDIDSVLLEGLRGKIKPDERYKLYVERNHYRKAAEKMQNFLNDESKQK